MYGPTAKGSRAQAAVVPSATTRRSRESGGDGRRPIHAEATVAASAIQRAADSRSGPPDHRIPVKVIRKKPRTLPAGHHDTPVGAAADAGGAALPTASHPRSAAPASAAGASARTATRGRRSVVPTASAASAP